MEPTDQAPPGWSRDEARRHEMLQAGLDLLDQGLTVFDADLRMVAWNQTFVRLLGFPEGMARPGAPFEEFIRYNAERGEYGAGDVDEIVRDIVARARSFNPHHTERRRPNGRLLAVRGAPLPHRGFITVYTDITEQRHYESLIERQNAELEERVRQRTAELETINARLLEANAANFQIAASLRQSEERLRLITDRVPANIGYFDAGQIFRYANKGYSEWFRMPVERIVGNHIEAVIGERVYASVGKQIARALRGEQVSYEYSIERDDGRPAYARSTLVPEFDAERQVLGCFVLALDITEQKRTQEALVQAQKMEAIGQLTGGLAHDFNNMLTVVIGNLGVLREHGAATAQDEEHLDSALQAARRGVDLIRRLLAFSRQQPLATRPIDVGQLAQEMAKLMRRSLPESITLSTSVRDAPLVALADANQLDSALLNLVLNARDAMPAGGRIDIELSPQLVGERDAERLGVKPGQYVSIAVSDNGSGMDAATQARVFEPFFTTKSFGKGSGLGMAMVYGFVQQSGGSARIASTPGQGTTVSLLLPRAGEEIAGDEIRPPAVPAADADKRLVLLVEDDPDVRRIVRTQLTELGYPVLEAENGPEALKIIENVAEIGCVLSDVVMPGGLDGRAVAERAHRLRPGLQFILMSGYAHEADAAAASSQTPMLAKPFSKSELARAIQGNDR